MSCPVDPIDRLPEGLQVDQPRLRRIIDQIAAAIEVLVNCVHPPDMDDHVDFTNFCTRAGGSDLNAGTRTGNLTEPGVTADLTYTAGAWVQATRVFTVASGDPVADAVAIGDYAALDTGGATAVLIARVTARTSTTITLNSVFAGANPANGTYTLRIGGAWAGPAGASGFPFAFLNNGQNLKNALSYPIRINCKNDQTYTVSAQVVVTINVALEGYTTSYGDDGRATFTGGTTGASYTPLLFTAAVNRVRNFLIANNGATGSAVGVQVEGGTALFERCIIKGMRGSGMSCTINPGNILNACEITGNNTSNTVNEAGINTLVSMALNDCIIHGNTGSNTSGMRIATSANTFSMNRCVFAANGAHGLTTGSGIQNINDCVFYGNVTGLNVTTAGGVLVNVDNSIFEANTTPIANAGTHRIRTRNCGFFGNTVGSTGVTDELGSITGTASFMNDPANGDFTGNESTYGIGIATFLETVTYSDQTVSFPDIGCTVRAGEGVDPTDPPPAMSAMFRIDRLPEQDGPVDQVRLRRIIDQVRMAIESLAS